MNRIIKNLVANFLEKQEIPSEGDDVDFEKFGVYTYVTHDYPREFDLETVLTGGGDDTSIDGIALIVNGSLIENENEIEHLQNTNNNLDATYIFVQVKNSPHIESGELSSFGNGVKDFFSDDPKLRRNARIEEIAGISNFLFKKSSFFKVNPKCKLYFITTGDNSKDQNVDAVCNFISDDLKRLELFSEIKIILNGSDEISNRYRNISNAVTSIFTFNEKVVLPELPSVKEAYFGVLPLSEFKKLLVDENENLRDVFYDNIRDFQGLANPINTKIFATLKGENPELFTVLNNGITIVASDVRTSGNKFTVTDYQIVNGCQTSNILYMYIKETDEKNDIRIPLKLVITQDEEIKSLITVATNSQTSVRREQLQAMTQFQKKIEQFYDTFESDDRIYYERRSGQYQSSNSIKKSRIISISTQAKAFASMYLDIPHLATTYFGRVVSEYIEENQKIFSSNHQPIWYYTSALAYQRLDLLFRTRIISNEFRKFKWFILMIFGREVMNQSVLNIFSSERKANKICTPIIELLNYEDETRKYMQKSAEILKNTGIDLLDKQLLKSNDVTEKIKRLYVK